MNISIVEAERRIERCDDVLYLSPAAVQAFEDRLVKLVRHEEWPVQGWYHDQDFSQAFNTALKMKEERDALLWLFSYQFATESTNAGIPEPDWLVVAKSLKDAYCGMIPEGAGKQQTG